MTDDELYLNAIMKQRIMRQTHDSKTLHRIYADKYANWLVPFFKEHDILDIPVLCICNTLYRLPDYFRIEEKSSEHISIPSLPVVEMMGLRKRCHC